MNIINEILREPEFDIKPPILMDVGASGKIHNKWKKIAKYSICIAVDADEREFIRTGKKNPGFKKLYLLKDLVDTRTSENIPFYLTKSPYCSSTLEPDIESLKQWAFADAFQIEKIDTTNSIDIADVLDNVNVRYIDWFKSDSQGIDLRLFHRLTEHATKPPLAAEFEPGIIHAYCGEDLFQDVLAAMNGSDYWLSSLHVRGSKRIPSDLQSVFGKVTFKGKIPLAIRNSPCWCEMTYLHTVSGDRFEKRDYLLAIVFSLIEKQYGAALELAERGSRLFGDKIFKKIYKTLIRRISFRTLNIPVQIVRRAFFKYR
jgi:hypothetical protein